MQYDQFIAQVQQRARLTSRSEAEAAVQATLETLAERLTGGGTATVLPVASIRQLLRERMPEAGGEFDRDEFFLRVNAREGIANLPRSMHHAQTILAVLSEAMPPAEVEKIKCSLPEEFRRLFEPNGASQTMRYEEERQVWRDEPAMRRGTPGS